MIAGTEVTLLSDRDMVIKRKLVSVENGVYFVCKTEEFESAAREKREPKCIGFRREYLIDPKVVISD
jgi:hypothetical protein